MDVERRSHSRQFLDIKVRVGDVYGRSKNISIGGLHCITFNEVPILTELKIIIYTDESKIGGAIVVTGTALRCTPITRDLYDVGIYFNSSLMSDQTRCELKDFLGYDF